MGYEPYVGEIALFGGHFAPTGWAHCHGQLLPIADYAALFSLIGTYYGGDGVRTFALPDLRGRVPAGQGQGPGLEPYFLGQPGGRETVTLLTDNLPPHKHALMGNAVTAGQTAPAPNAVLGPSTNAAYSNKTPNVALSPNSIGVTGLNWPLSILQPYLALNFIIALKGVYPSRG